jgi:hypothetical protein
MAINRTTEARGLLGLANQTYGGVMSSRIQFVVVVSLILSGCGDGSEDLVPSTAPQEQTPTVTVTVKGKVTLADGSMLVSEEKPRQFEVSTAALGGKRDFDRVMGTQSLLMASNVTLGGYGAITIDTYAYDYSPGGYKTWSHYPGLTYITTTQSATLLTLQTTLCNPYQWGPYTYVSLPLGYTQSVTGTFSNQFGWNFDGTVLVDHRLMILNQGPGNVQILSANFVKMSW